MNKLLIIYRACNLEVSQDSVKNVSRPSYFNKKSCFRSFYNSFGANENVEIIVVFDGKLEDELAQYITNTLPISKYLSNVGNQSSLIYCYNLASKLSYENVFFIEDDYLFLPDSYEILIEGLECFDGHFVTLYDHYNRYLPPHITGDVTMGYDYCLITKSTHWRSGDSTTGSVAMNKRLFDKVKDRLVFHNIHDCAFYREMLSSGLRIFNCIPAKATHVNKVYNSPLIDWERYNNSIEL